MQITIPGATVGLPPAFFEWLRANDVIVEQISAVSPFHISDEGILAGTTIFGSPFERPILVPADDYLAGWLLKAFGEQDEDNVGPSILDDMKPLYDQLCEARQAERDAKQRAEEARDQLLARMRIEGSTVGTIDGRPALERKVIESKRLDGARLRREQPDIAEIYTSTSMSERLEIL